MIDQGNQANTGPGTPRPGTQSDTLSSEKLKQQGRESAHEVGEVVQQQAEDYYTQQRDNAAEQTQKLTGVLQKMADEFDQQQQPFFSKQARKFADTTERFSHNLRDKDLRSVCSEAQSFSRREPALFVGGLIAAGFLASRFLRSSSHHTHSADATTEGRHLDPSPNYTAGSPMQGATPPAPPTGAIPKPTTPGTPSNTLSDGPSHGRGGFNEQGTSERF